MSAVPHLPDDKSARRKITRKELGRNVARELGIPQVLGQKAVNTALRMIAEMLEREGVVSLTDFGVFKVSPRSARTGRNPATQEEVDIPARNTVTFKPSAKLRDKVNVD